VENGVKDHSIGFFEETHRSPEYAKTIRPQVVLKALLSIPFFNEIEFILILDILTKVTTEASFFFPDEASE